MGVLLTEADGRKKKFADTEGKRFFYRTTEAGVLRVVRVEEGKPTVAEEFSPAGWLAVKGDRYLAEVTGRMESAAADPEAPAKVRRAIVL